MLRLIAGMLAATAALAQQPRLDLPVDWIAPAPAASRIVYAYAAGSLFRTRDLGASWTALSIRPSGAQQPELSGLLVTASSPNVVYALGRARDGAVWRSVDGGDSWRAANTGLPSTADFVRDATMHGVDPNLIYLRIGAEVYKTRNGGAQWARISRLAAAGPYLELLVSAGENRTIYYANTGTVFRSTDDGETWQHVYAPPGAQRFRSVAVDRVTPATLVAHHSTDPPEETTEIVRSPDGGFHWGPLTGLGRVARLIAASGNVLYGLTATGAVARSVSAGNHWAVSPAGIARAIAVDPLDPLVVYTGANGVSSSIDGGATFTPMIGTVRLNFARPAAEISFRVLAGGTAAIVVPARAIENATWAIPFTASSSAPWAVWSAATGTTPSSPTLRIDTTGLAPGVYTADVTFESPQAAVNLTIPVTLRVDADIGPSAPQFTASTIAPTPAAAAAVAVDPAGNLFFATEDGVYRANGEAPASLLAAVRNVTGLAAAADGSIYAGRSSPPAVLRVADSTVSPLFRAADTPAPASVPARVRLDSEGRLLVAASSAILRFSAATPPPVTLLVSAPPGAVFSDASPDDQGNLYIADSARHAIYRWSAADRSLSPVAGRPGTAGLAGDGGAASESLLNAPAAIARAGDGTLYVADSGNARLRVITSDGRIYSLPGPGVDVAIDASGALYSPRRESGIVKLTPLNNLPEISRGGFVNSATNRPALSPGSLFSLYGKNLFALDATVTINGRRAPLFYVTSEQINGQVPWETETGLAAAAVTKEGLTSLPESTVTVAAAPGILTFGEGRAVVSPDTAAPGGLVNVFLTGIGPVNPPVATGAAASVAPLSRAVLPARATLAGRDCEITFLGLTPGEVGLAHATVRIPAGLEAGDHTLVVRINGVDSNPALIAVTGGQP